MLRVQLLSLNCHFNIIYSYLYVIYIYIYMSWVQITLGVTLSNITLLNNLLFNSYFKNPSVNLHILYVFNMYANFHINWMLFTIRFINLFLYIILNYKNLNLNNWLMDRFEIFYVWRIYKNNIIQQQILLKFSFN